MKIDDFFEKISPITNWSGVLKAAGIEPTAMSKHRQGHQPLTWHHYPAIVRILCSLHGCIEIDGLTIRVDPDGPAFFLSRAIRQGEIIETEDGGFEYPVVEVRDICDDHDLYQLFQCA